MSTFHLTVTSPDGNLFDGDAVSVSLRGADGNLAILAGHTPFITSVKPCDCKIELEDGSIRTGHTEGGLLAVSAGKTTLLSGSFHW